MHRCVSTNTENPLKASTIIRSMTETSDDGDDSSTEESEKAPGKDIMEWFLKEPESPIFMSMVKKLSPDMWDPMKYQLDSAPVFYCGVEGVQPKDLPFTCFVDVDDAKAHLKLLKSSSGKGFGGKGGDEMEGTTKMDVIPMLLGDAYENAAVGYSKIRASTIDQQKAKELSDNESLSVDEAFVPVFGIKTLAKSETDDSFITGLTDRVYFDGAQAQRILEQVKELYETEDEKYELFVVSLTKAIEYMILDKESEFKFDFVPPESSLEYLTSKQNS